MRIFIHGVDTYLGKVLVSELRKVDGGFHRVFGTVSQGVEGAPKVVKRIVHRDDPKKAKKMIETLQSCKVIVIDLFSCTLEDLHFAIKALKVDPTQSPPKPTGELEGEVTFVLISSAGVWANTEASQPDGFLKESDWQRRQPIPGSMYEQWKEMEDLVMSCFNREGSTVKALVVAGGALYGEGEDCFSGLFKDAWCGDMKHLILGTGQNRIPTVHSRDLARLVRHVMDNANIVAADTPYFLAVDQPPVGEGEKALPSTQAEIVQGIVDEICDPFQVPSVEEWPEPDTEDPVELSALTPLQATLAMNIRMEPSAHMLDPEFASVSDPPGWHCKEGLLKNIRKIADEFCKERKLRAMRVLLGGPPASGKSTLATHISLHFRVPHHELADSGFESMVEVLSTRVCRYRGYVLDARSMGFAEVERLFRFDIEVPREEGEEPPPADEENGEELQGKQYTRQLHEDICPAFVVVTQAPRGLCEGRYMQSHGKDKADEFRHKMDHYLEANLTDGVHSLSDFFQDVAKSSVMNLPVAGKDDEDLFESTRIYMEREGRPFNYLPTEAEVASEILAKREALRKAENEAAAAGADLEGKGAVQQSETRRQAERMAIISKHLKEHQQLRDTPVREYLMEYMIPSLTEGLIEVCKVMPDNPTDYLAKYLEEHAAASEL
mmetsp:Transcript_55904/g.181209  ORF Transcript_55904/g.181209 Transcript_55904/m.181209 type:complete len:665 (+) Transcript_55904:90-2084(+)